MKNRLSVLFLSVFLIFTTSQAQFSGKVVDESKNPLQDVMILNLNTFNHTHSDEHGNFMDVFSQVGDSLKFSFLGFKSLTKYIDNKTDKEVLITLEESPILLNLVNVSEPLSQNLQKIDLKFNPVQNTQELMRKVPGLFLAQHAGGGKAEQIFLRGFDIDHGTDINISVDHFLPVNMVSHAHGQGYADLHFVIPETVKNIDFEKGSYNASKGNFATAGYVDFKLKDQVKNNLLVLETGKFQYNRIASAIKLLDKSKNSSYIAGEYLSSDGYFENPQDFHKFNGLVKYNYKLNNYSGLKLLGTYFESKWNASGQIPTREVLNGNLSRFGALDPNEGGQTSRINALARYYLTTKMHQTLKISAFYTKYDFELYSNFTFFLNDSINGDQIRQKENRNIFGVEMSVENKINKFEYEAAIGTRIDDIHNLELSHTKDRVVLLERKALGNLNENNVFGYLKLAYETYKWELQLQNRLDLFNVNYENLLITNNPISSNTELRMSPKLNINYNINNHFQIYQKSGLGFHTNDTRLLSSNSDANTTTRSINFDLGVQFKPFNNSLIHAGLWYIDLEDELVYVGDEAVVESSGHTKRKGLEIGMRWQGLKYLSLDAEASYTLAKSVDNPEGSNYIPLAAKWCSSGGITLQNIHNFSCSLRYRYLGDRPANEDYSITAKGYNLLDGNINYQYKNINFGFVFENILNREWNEAQFATESRLKNELNPVEEIHFTPGTPFNLRFKIGVSF
ncbi:MAG: carboxypeptidase-like regulatory domain-containing protein [Saprospiraceae bacterium]